MVTGQQIHIFHCLVLLNYPLYLSGTVTITSKPCSGSKRRGIVVKCQFDCRQVVGAHKLELLESTVSQAEFLVLLSLSQPRRSADNGGQPLSQLSFGQLFDVRGHLGFVLKLNLPRKWLVYSKPLFLGYNSSYVWTPPTLFCCFSSILIQDKQD